LQTVASRRLQVDGRTTLIGILSDEGFRVLRSRGHAAVARACAAELPAGDVRFVDASIRQAVESATDAELNALYSAPFPARPFVTDAPVTRGAATTIGLRIQPDLACLRGHFPCLPIVPGASQLGWALEFAAEILGTPSALRAARAVKFERIIQPGRSLLLHLSTESGGAGLRFEYVSGSGRHSAGRIETNRADA
jgi:3-hydroxymyristoyl/3-hydroxydecanoyl-(acyl carrier protein) dehydratase